MVQIIHERERERKAKMLAKWTFLCVENPPTFFLSGAKTGASQVCIQRDSHNVKHYLVVASLF